MTLGLAWAVASAAGAQAPAAKVTASLARLFGSATRVDTVRIDSSTVFRISRHDSLLGFAQVRNARGKDQPITYLVAVDAGGRLKDVDVLVYREPYGGEVAYESWRKQFRGKTSGSPIAVGRDIRGISGATISVHAVTAGVRQTVVDLAEWRRRGALR